MIDIKEVIDFFDNIADKWDEMEIRSDEVINKIMDNGGIEEGVSVLDVACGTGTLIPDYLKRNVAKIFSKFLRVTVIVSDEKMYQVVGIK